MCEAVFAAVLLPGLYHAHALQVKDPEHAASPKVLKYKASWVA